ncbi:hypothetical protein [Syntrophorhabdus aromaticivorans]|jgi:hypothetical protein|uniref:hypothetical protein n=1 Tax=Syntrophorhabdus aromaticivorans TaxID=328301 RepID=UPI000402E776|nr:hypothetical protein [Syntrophorhabdus aromaticivorans]
MVFRDGRFWQLPKDPVVQDSLTLPPGMTPEEFVARKEKLKRKALVTFGLAGLFLTLFPGFLLWTYGTLEPVQQKSLQELLVAKGTYYVRTHYRSRSREYQTGIKDPKSGRVIVTAEDGLCGVGERRWSFEGKPAIMWYAIGPGGGKIKVVYQLEVNGRPACSLDYTNDRIMEANMRRKLSGPLVIGGFLFIAFCTGAVLGYGTYHRDIRKLFAREG